MHHIVTIIDNEKTIECVSTETVDVKIGLVASTLGQLIGANSRGRTKMEQYNNAMKAYEELKRIAEESMMEQLMLRKEWGGANERA